MNKGLKIGLIISAILLSIGIYYSIKGPLDFNEDRDERYISVIAQLQDIGALQKEYYNQTGKFLGSVDSLISFADTAVYIIRERKDTAIITTNAQGIKITQDKTIYRELGRIPVKDSLFKNRDYKSLTNMKVGTKGPYKTEVRMKYDMNEDSTDYTTTYFFKTSATKEDILNGLNENYIINEKSEGKSIPEEEIYIGSLIAVSTEGNWTPEFDYWANELNKEENQQSESEK